MWIFKNQSRQIEKNKTESEARLRAFAFQNEDVLMAALSTSPAGLSSARAEENLDEFGKNRTLWPSFTFEYWYRTRNFEPELYT